MVDDECIHAASDARLRSPATSSGTAAPVWGCALASPFEDLRNLLRSDVAREACLAAPSPGRSHPLAHLAVVSEPGERGIPLVRAMCEQAGLSLAQDVQVRSDRRGDRCAAGRHVLDDLVTAFVLVPFAPGERHDADMAGCERARLRCFRPGHD